MGELKTLKDIWWDKSGKGDYLVDVNELKQEVIKWINKLKEMEDYGGDIEGIQIYNSPEESDESGTIILVLMKMFDISEEDLEKYKEENECLDNQKRWLEELNLPKNYKLRTLKEIKELCKILPDSSINIGETQLKREIGKWIKELNNSLDKKGFGYYALSKDIILDSVDYEHTDIEGAIKILKHIFNISEEDLEK